MKVLYLITVIAAAVQLGCWVAIYFVDAQHVSLLNAIFFADLVVLVVSVMFLINKIEV